MAQKLAPAEKNSTDISAASATFCISDPMASYPIYYNSLEQKGVFFQKEKAEEIININEAMVVNLKGCFYSSSGNRHLTGESLFWCFAC